jgi:hypothetical protein
LSFIAGTPSYGRVYLLSKYRCLSLVLRLRMVFEVTAITAMCERAVVLTIRAQKKAPQRSSQQSALSSQHSAKTKAPQESST